ncbi:MAG TPA: hypothetical protein VKP67_00995 [Xanthobacteraceae bacterium]|nr:hypothetical protein [Xanthobacteraceae bacterium]
MVTRAEDYLDRAAICERLAKGMTDPQMKRLLEDVAHQWRHLASLVSEAQERTYH